MLRYKTLMVFLKTLECKMLNVKCFFQNTIETALRATIGYEVINTPSDLTHYFGYHPKETTNERVPNQNKFYGDIRLLDPTGKKSKLQEIVDTLVFKVFLLLILLLF